MRVGIVCLIATAAVAALLLPPLNGAIAQGIATSGNAPVLSSGLSTTVKTIKSSPGRVVVLDCVNPSAAAAYVQLFDVASGTAVTLGTTVPKASIGFQTLTARNVTLNINMLLGIKAAATTTATGSAAPATALDCSFAIN